MIEKIENITWEDFIDDTYSKDYQMQDFIYRGQSNEYTTSGEFNKWKVKSSFNRFYTKENYRFSSFLDQHLNDTLFTSTYGNYEFVKRTKLIDSDFLTRLYFLQHYSIPTCLLDFTFNPLVALYFSMSSLKGHQGGQYDINGFPLFYPDECKITIYRINYKILIEKFNLEEINKELLSDFVKYQRYKQSISDYTYSYIGIDLFPYKKISSSVDNYNLKKQDSAFILFDNLYSEQYGLIEFLIEQAKSNNIQFDKPMIKEYNINYNCLYSPMHSKQPDYIPAFRYLEENGITGKKLFNDYQSLRYDFNFFHNK